MDKDEKKDRKKLTTGTGSDDNQKILTSKGASGIDPRIVALVRFLARRAAERDFAKLIEGPRKVKAPGDGIGTIQ